MEVPANLSQFFAHERGYYMAIYTVVLTASNYLAPVWAGFANDTLGWAWTFWISAIIAALQVVILFLFMEETNYNRGTSELSDKHDDAAVERVHDSESVHGEADKKDADVSVRVAVTTANEYTRELVGTEYSYLKKIAPYRERYATMKMFWTQVYRPFIFLRYPVVVWSGLIYGSGLIWYNVLNGKPLQPSRC